MYNSNTTTSPGSAPLVYSITFKPNSVGSPDLVTYRGISNINITLYNTGQSCTIKQRGGQNARYKRNKTRQEWKLKQPDEKEKNEEKEKLKQPDERCRFCRAF